MASSLIECILLQADNADTKLEGMPELNESLKKGAHQGFIFKKLSGGLGLRGYDSLKSSFVLNEKQVIIAINEDELLNGAQHFLTDAQLEKEKSAYKAGVCLALLTVYAGTAQKRLAACEQLAALYQPKGPLKDASMLARCKEFLQPISVDGVFYPTNRIIRSWELKGALEVLSFEEKRQNALCSDTVLTIRGALYLLGLAHTDNKLDREKISQASTLCKQRLKSIAVLKAQGLKDNALFQNFQKAEHLLLNYEQFKRFNYKQSLQVLDEKVAAVAKASLSEELIFNEAYQAFKDLEYTVKQLVELAYVDAPYLTKDMIRGSIGVKVGTQFEVQVQLEKLARNYWDLVGNKIEPLILEGSKFQYGIDFTAKEIESIRQLRSKVGNALAVVEQIKGSALEDPNIVSDVATDVAEQGKRLSYFFETLGEKIERYEGKIKKYTTSIIELNQRAAKEKLDMVHDADLNQFISDKQSTVQKIDEYLSWLQHLDSKAIALASSQFNTQVLSQATLNEVVTAVAQELSTLDAKLGKTVRENAMITFLGARNYNRSRPLHVAVERFFNSNRTQDLQMVATLLIEGVKAAISDQTGEKADISAKGLIPEATYLTFEIAVQQLEANKVKFELAIKTASTQLNEELQSTIKMLGERYKKTAAVLQRAYHSRSSLRFSWQQQFGDFLRLQAVLYDDFANLSKKIPTDFFNVNYLSSELKSLIGELYQQDETLKNEAKEMNYQIAGASVDVLKYFLLKRCINKERKLYIAQGKHDSARTDSLERLAVEIERLDGIYLPERFALLIEALKKEREITAISHQQIGFLGHYRPSRLQKMYTKIIDEVDNIEAYAPQYAQNMPLNLDTLQYISLKNLILLRHQAYIKQGTHHQDRIDSWARLRDKIAELDGQAGLSEKRFSALYLSVQQEKIATTQSHFKVGFFGDWRPCRLQTVYDEILAQGANLDYLAADGVAARRRNVVATPGR